MDFFRKVSRQRSACVFRAERHRAHLGAFFRSRGRHVGRSYGRLKNIENRGSFFLTAFQIGAFAPSERATRRRAPSRNLAPKCFSAIPRWRTLKKPQGSISSSGKRRQRLQHKKVGKLNLKRQCGDGQLMPWPWYLLLCYIVLVSSQSCMI